MTKRQTRNDGLIAVAIVLGFWWYSNRQKAGASPALDKSTGTPARPFGDPADPGSVANACNAAFRVTRLGHPMQAAPWIQICHAGGGTVPQTADQQYT